MLRLQDLDLRSQAITRLFTICQSHSGKRRANGLRDRPPANGPRFHERSPTILLILSRARAHVEFRGSRGMTSTGLYLYLQPETAKHGVCHERVRYVPYSEWDRCSRDES